MIHRFYTGHSKDRSGELQLTERLWVNDPGLVNQWLRVLRMRSGEELVLFNGNGQERLYRIEQVEEKAVHLQHVTDFQPKYPSVSLSLAWSLLKKDKNEWVLQKCTELGVSHFLPIISERTEKTGFDTERAHKILIESSEQCGRHDIPTIIEPQSLQSLINEHTESKEIVVADMGGARPKHNSTKPVLLVVGPEGGWADKERELFAHNKLDTIGLGDFTLRAETASISAVYSLLSTTV
jgi:16S rRNA (uracil1498-N3)-methyltransferase